MTARQRRQRNKARTYVARAVAAGRLIKPTLCEECGAQAALQGHHEKGYAPRYWLWVRWLCIPCHAAAEPRGWADDPLEMDQRELDFTREAAPLGDAEESDDAFIGVYDTPARRARAPHIHPHLFCQIQSRSRVTGRRLTARDLAPLLGISAGYLSLLRNGHYVPSREMMERMAAQFPHMNLSVQEIAAWHVRHPPTPKRDRREIEQPRALDS